MPDGSVISRYGVGFDSIDLNKASENNVHIANTPGVLNNAVAEHTIWMIGSLARNVASSNIDVQLGKWVPTQGIEIKGRKLALLGFGRIAQDICKKAHYGFGMNVVGYDQFSIEKMAEFAGHDSVESFQKEVPVEKITNDLDEAIKDADFVAIMMAVTPETVGFANKELFSIMKDDAYLINTARGQLVNEDDLFDALTNGDIAVAGLDVFVSEPYEPVTKAKDLRSVQNIVMTPHVASNTKESNHQMATTAAQNIMTTLMSGPDACKNILNR